MKSILTLCFLSFGYLIFAQNQSGKASFYADKFEGRKTASGEIYVHHKMTAAHRTLPFGTWVRVINQKNGKEVVVKVNDRGPFVAGRIIDLSKSAAEKLDMVRAGVADVHMEVLQESPPISPQASEPNPEPQGQPPVDTQSSDANPDSQGVPPVAELTPPAPRELYNFDISRVSPEGFGVQIASYREMANLARFVDELKHSFKRNVILQVKNVNDQKYYSLIVSGFKDRVEAESFMKKIEERYPDAFIVAF